MEKSSEKITSRTERDGVVHATPEILTFAADRLEALTSLKAIGRMRNSKFITEYHVKVSLLFIYSNAFSVESNI